MYCSDCGAQNPDVSSFCFGCGKALAPSIPQPAAAIPAVANPTPATVASREEESLHRPVDPEIERIRVEHPELIGVGGWLKWFCFVVTILSPLIVVAGAFSDFTGYSLFDLGLAAYSIYTGVNVWNVSPRALRFVKVLLIIHFCLGALIIIGNLGTPAANDPAGSRMLISSIVWFSYFKKSKRVKATFGRPF
jgi:zinc-ribbon domain